MEPTANPSPTNPSQLNKKKKNTLVDNIVSFGVALFFVMMIRSSVIEAFKIPSGSMIPTLLVGDHIFVNKFAYGLKVPFTEWIMDEPLYFYHGTPPQRGDIVVFKYPKDPSLYYIKRVIGTPGDRVSMRNKQLYINDIPVERTEVSPETRTKIMNELKDTKYNFNSLVIMRETHPSASPTVMVDSSQPFNADFDEITVPADKYFCMGDNRDFSNDSRFWGFVPMENIKGKAMIIWLSAWIDFSHSENSSFKPGRIGTILN